MGGNDNCRYHFRGVQRKDAADDTHQYALARAVFSPDQMDFSAAQRKIDALQNGILMDGFAQIANLQRSLHVAHPHPEMVV